MTAVLDKFGRILLPKKLRQALGLQPDSQLILRQEGNRIILEPKPEESLVQEPDGFWVYAGEVDEGAVDWVSKEREDRDKRLLGL